MMTRSWNRIRVVLVLVSVLGGCGAPAGFRDGAVEAAMCLDAVQLARDDGVGCACDSECRSGFCIDGVCCNRACPGECSSCLVPGKVGSCSPLPSGSPPRSPGACPEQTPDTCGHDGMCDGAGACRRHPAGTVCVAGTCSGDAVTGMSVCDGAGACIPGPDVVCVPYGCDSAAGACFERCSDRAGCAGSRTCVDGSCGAKLNGSGCRYATECASGHCVDGVCCATACDVPCMSCDHPGKAGRCLPVPDGTADVNDLCHAGTGLCADTGLCQAGLCVKPAAGTVCATATCSGSVLSQTAVCNGAGQCQAASTRDCAPFRCVPAGGGAACLEACSGDADCVAPAICRSGSCGLKTNGGSCADDVQCQSGICADGVCCNARCSGGCRSCALTGSVGTCTMVPAGSADPRGTCPDQGARTCGTNGRCDGAGECQRYVAGTLCAGETCSGGSYTPPSSCDDGGHCVRPSSRSCSPYACNGPRCYESCAASSSCLPPNECLGGSCGLKSFGASCSSAAECGSGSCAQGVCCTEACAAACRSCALPASLGSCRAVADGAPDPAGVCRDRGAASCDQSGVCTGGACARYPSGTQCAAPACSGGTASSARLCDGNGVCKAATASPCWPYACDAVACRLGCSSADDCASPATCLGGSCGLKPDGMACSSADECASAHCVDGVCCDTTCTGACRSCNLAGRPGTCTMVGSGGSDPHGICPVTVASTCGTDGTCDGLGGCAKHVSGTRCAGPTCDGTTATSARLCDGAGTCMPAIQSSCVPFVCGPSACKTSCTSSSECVAPSLCLGSTCTLKPNGTSCGAPFECLSGECVDGVCCDGPCTGACRSCNLSGHAGTCTLVASAQPDPRESCTVSAISTCGSDGTCDGRGACHLHDAGRECAGASCLGSVLNAASVCDGGGRCVAGAQRSCAPYRCGVLACKTACSANSDCASGYVCVGDTCGAALGLGQICSRGDQCGSGHCTDGRCCGTATCASPTCSDSALTIYRCGALGACSGQTTSCGDHACNAAGDACLTSCTSDTECSPGNVCSSGSCGPALDGGSPD